MKNLDLKSLSTRLVHSGFFHIFGSSTVNQFIQFAHGILIIRFISKEDYGVYAYASNIYLFFLLFSGFGILDAILQLSSEHATNVRKSQDFINYGYYFGVRFNLFLAATILIASYTVKLPVPGSNEILRIMFFLPVFLIIKNIQVISLRVSLRNKEYGTINTFEAISSSVLTVVGAWLYQARGIVFGQYISLIVVMIVLWKHYGVSWAMNEARLSKADKKDVFGIASISILNNALSQVLTLVGTLILGMAHADASSIASYKVASTIPMAMSVIPASLVIYVYPYFARNKNNRLWVAEKYALLMALGGAGNLAIALGGIVLAVPIISIIFGAQYLDAVVPFRILMISYFVSGTFRTVAGNLLVTQRKLKFNLFVGVLGAVVSIVLNILLIPTYGAIGAAWSQLLTMMITGVLATVYFVVVIRTIKAETVEN